jgi:hypothetical protein
VGGGVGFGEGTGVGGTGVGKGVGAGVGHGGVGGGTVQQPLIGSFFPAQVTKATPCTPVNGDSVYTSGPQAPLAGGQVAVLLLKLQPPSKVVLPAN